MRALIVVMGLLLAPTAFAFDHTHKVWDDDVKKYVKDNGLVDYKGWKKAQDPLSSYLKTLSAVTKAEFAKFTVPQQKAFLINAYNAFTVRLILDNYPLKSIKDVGGLFGSPWKKEFFSILEGDIKSLDPIEHEYLRKKDEYKDARVHAAVNCASIGCPPLRGEAFVAENLDAQMTDSTKRWLADASRNKIDAAKNRVEISKIFDWFEVDFGDNDAGVIAFLKKYGPVSAQKLTAEAEIDYLDYDWALNETK